LKRSEAIQGGKGEGWGDGDARGKKGGNARSIFVCGGKSPRKD